MIAEPEIETLKVIPLRAFLQAVKSILYINVRRRVTFQKSDGPMCVLYPGPNFDRGRTFSHVIPPVK
jgi:hypothetical protein